MTIRCAYCGKRPDEIDEYIEAAKYFDVSPDRYVRWEEGTFNPDTEHFACTRCYIAIGAPASRHGWKAP
jgi:hypothetical protein